MSRESLRTVTTVTAMLGASLLAAAACGKPSIQAVPVPASTPSASATAAATPGPAVTKSPARTPSKRPQSTTGPPSCRHAVFYTFDISLDTSPWPTLCMEVGGVLRLANSGPGTVSASPEGKVVCFYEGGVHECRLVRTGTVKFTVDNSFDPDGPYRSRVLILVIAATTPGPTPACAQPGDTRVVAIRDSMSQRSADCFKLGAVLSFDSLGPGSYTVAPSGVASCSDRAGFTECRFTKTGTVVFTFAGTADWTRVVEIVVIK